MSGFPPSENPFEAPQFNSDPRAAAENAGTDLTTVDWLIIVFCAGIACIVGVIRLIQGKPNAGKMIGFSLLSAFLWSFLRIVITALSQQ